MYWKSVWRVALLLAVIAMAACGDDVDSADGTGGTGGLADGGGGSAAPGAAGGAEGANDPDGDDDLGGSAQEGLDGSWNDGYEVCTLGRCADGSDTAVSCRETFDFCVGRGHYARSCRMDADMTCGVFGETGPY